MEVVASECGCESVLVALGDGVEFAAREAEGEDELRAVGDVGDDV